MSKTSSLSLVILAATVIYVIMLFTGFFPQHWLTADILLPVNGTYLSETRPVEVFALVLPGQQEIFNQTGYFFTITSKMGLYTNCKDSIGDIGGNILTDYTCDSEGAEEWQKVAFAGAAGSLMFGLACLVMSVMGTFMKRYKDSVTFRFAIVVINCATIVLTLCPVMLYSTNRRFQVKPPLPTFWTFELGWALKLTLGAAGISGFVLMLNTYLITALKGGQDDNGDNNKYQINMAKVNNGEMVRF